MGSSKKTTVGHWYALGVHAVICHGPVDAVKALSVGERRAWTGNITSNTSVRINKRELFGGEKREGGLDGYMDVMLGADDQVAHPTLVDVRGDVPAYRGLLSLVFRGATVFRLQILGSLMYKEMGANDQGFIWSAMNPYLKPFWLKVRHVLANRPWYTAKAAIGDDDMNPAHIIWDAMTNTKYGLGFPTGLMDDAAFRAAADKLYDEGFGLSLEWNSSTSGWDFVQLVLDHITGMVYIDPATGLFTIKLVRDDYVAGDLLTLDTSNIASFGSFERAAWGEITNTVVLTYTNPKTEKPADVTVHNLAAIKAQGGRVIASTVSLPGIRSQALAQRIAQRDLKVFSTPLAKVSLEINRIGYTLRPGDAVKLNWPTLGISGMVLRVSNIEYGTLTDGRIKVDAVEDVFGMPNTSYMSNQDDLWVDPSGPPTPVTEQRVMEASYYEIARAVAPSVIADYDPAFGFGKILAVKPDGLAIDYNVNASATLGGEYTITAFGSYTPTARLGAAVDKMETLFTLTNLVDFNDAALDGVCYIDDEAVGYVGYDEASGKHEFKRGILDTVPAAHAMSARLYMDVDQLCIDETERLDGETVYYKVLPTNGLGTLDPSLATAISLTLDQRYQRPYPPANLKVAGSYFPDVIVGAAAFTWVHRDRVQQTVGLVGFTEGSIGPEVGTTYTVKVYDASNTLLHTEAGLAGTSWTYTQAANGSSTLRVTVEAVRDGLTSTQKHDHTFQRAGLGFSLGKYLGGV